MHRFFLPALSGPQIHISSPDLIHQIRRVFRAKVGDSFIFFSVGTPDIVYELTDISHARVSFTQKEILPLSQHLGVHLTVFQAYPHKNDILELIVQKLVEVGVQKLVLFDSDRSQKNDISDQKRLRMAKIAQEALEQSGGNIPLEISYTQQSVVDIFHEYDDIIHIVGHPHAKNIKDPVLSMKNVGFWVGPEGGWSPREEDFFQQKSFTFWKFSNQILRLETASIVGSALLLYLAR